MWDIYKKFKPKEFSRNDIPELNKEIKRNRPSFTGANLRKVTDEDIAHMCEAALQGWESE